MKTSDVEATIAFFGGVAFLSLMVMIPASCVAFIGHIRLAWDIFAAALTNSVIAGTVAIIAGRMKEK